MKSVRVVGLGLLLFASGCSATDEEVLEELENFAHAVCGCDSRACALKVVEMYVRNPMLSEAGMPDPGG